MDITIDVDDYKLNVRAAGVMIHNGKILVHRNVNSDHYALIGGRVEIGESSANTIKREIKEELGKDIEITGYISTIENFFEMKGSKYHEIMFVHKIEFTNEEDKKIECMEKAVLENGFFAETFSVNRAENAKMKVKELPAEVGEVSDTFQCAFENSGIMKDGIIYTIKTVPNYHGKQITLGDVMETGEVEEQYFIPEEKLYYTDPSVTHSDETEQRLPKEDRQTWQYLKGAKKLLRTSSTGHEYVFSEGAISMIDQEDKPARTMLTSEGGFSRTTHIVKDKMTGRVRLLTATEAERIQGFPTDHTKYCLVKGETVEMPLRKRRFMMGNALVVNLVEDMEKTLDNIFDEE